MKANFGHFFEWPPKTGFTIPGYWLILKLFLINICFIGDYRNIDLMYSDMKRNFSVVVVLVSKIGSV